MAAAIVGNLIAKLDDKDITDARKQLLRTADAANDAQKDLDNLGDKGKKSMRKLGSGVDRLKEKLIALSKTPVLALAALAVAVGGAGTAVALYGSQIKDASEASGFSTDRIQTLQAAFGEMGVESELARDSLVDFGERVGEAMQTGGGAAYLALDSLGLSAKLMGGEFADVGEVFDAAMHQITKIEDPLKRQFLLTELGADGFRQLAGGLGDSTDALFAYEQQARNAGIISQENIEKSEALKEGVIRTAKEGFQVLSQAFLNMLPPAEAIGGFFVGMTNFIPIWIQALQNGWRALKDVGGVLADVFLPADALSGMMKGLGKMMDWVRGIFVGFATDTRVKVIGTLGALLETFRNFVNAVEGTPLANKLMPDGVLTKLDTAVAKINNLKQAAIDASSATSAAAPDINVQGGSSLSASMLTQLDNTDVQTEVEIAAAQLRETEKVAALKATADQKEAIAKAEADVRKRLLNEATQLEISNMDDEIARLQEAAEEKIRIKREEIGEAMALTSEYKAWEEGVILETDKAIAAERKTIDDKKRERLDDFMGGFVQSAMEGSQAMKNFTINMLTNLARIQTQKLIMGLFTASDGSLNSGGNGFASALSTLFTAGSSGGAGGNTSSSIVNTDASSQRVVNLGGITVNAGSDSNPGEVSQAVINGVQAVVRAETRSTIISETRTGGLLNR